MPEIAHIEILPILLFAATLLVAYLLGSIPTSIIVSKYFYKTDIRNYGSGNPGATNTFRILGTVPGIIVLLIDILKGLAAASLPLLFSVKASPQEALITLQLLFGVTAVLGHIFPVFARFQGGKGIATLFGMMLGILPIVALTCAGVFLVVLLLFKYVSLSSILATVTFPILIFFIYNIPNVYIRIFSILILLIVLITHRNNIKRLLNNNENKANLFDRDDSNE
jgi:glycerol-3-phosphate acyltransferase PlsY